MGNTQKNNGECKNSLHKLNLFTKLVRGAKFQKLIRKEERKS